MLAVVIIGTAVLASMTLLGVGTQTNRRSFSLVTALNLSETVRERMHGISYDAAVTENGRSYSPPLDVRGQPIEELAGWTQTLVITPVNKDDIDQPVGGPSDMARLTVDIEFNGTSVVTNSYLLVRTPE